MKKSSKSSLKKKKGLVIYLSSIKTKLAINFLKKNFCTWPKKWAGAERVNKFESNNIRFHKSLFADTGKLEFGGSDMWVYKTGP